ncbi:MAG: hypothetical protein AB7L41_08300 [Flavobacteriaceae bacterium]
MRTTIVACALALLLTGAKAAEGDMKTGTFEGYWCGAPAVFEVTRQLSGQWVFEGKILIRDTGQYDTLRIEQYSDNSLQIVRRLSGGDSGKRQWVVTNPPELRKKDGRSFVRFFAGGGKGTGCANLGSFSELLIYY